MPRYQQPFDKSRQKPKATAEATDLAGASNKTGDPDKIGLSNKSGVKQTQTMPNPGTSRSWGDWQKPARMGLIAGEGALPAVVAKNALALGIEVIPFVISTDNADALGECCAKKPVRIVPGMLKRNLQLLQEEKLSHLVFAGKVNKWILLRDPRMDTLAIEAFKTVLRKSDDDVMLWLVSELGELGFEILPQTLFLDDCFVAEGCLSRRQPEAQRMADIRYGFSLAKEMGRLDVGQTVVVKDGMLIAVEAIEGTDACLKRAGELACGKFSGGLLSFLRKPFILRNASGRNSSGTRGGVVVKVAKPLQDQRFDVPTVGLRTLSTMRKAGLDTLATEAGETLFLDKAAMIRYADRHGMTLISVAAHSLQ